MALPIVTLTTNWVSDDFYIAAVKGQLLSHFRELTIVDITHRIEPFQLAPAALIVKHAFSHFPKGSIHILGVAAERNVPSSMLAVEYDGHFFLGADNGIFSLMFDPEPQKAVCIAMDAAKGIAFSSFPELTVLVPAAIELLKGAPLEALGEACMNPYRMMDPLPVVDDKRIMGSVIYIDSYRNVISNIDREVFEQACQGREFIIYAQSNHNKIHKLSQFYNEVAEGELVALFNSIGLLEIAINNGAAAELLTLQYRSNIRIDFF